MIHPRFFDGFKKIATVYLRTLLEHIKDPSAKKAYDKLLKAKALSGKLIHRAGVEAAKNVKGTPELLAKAERMDTYATTGINRVLKQHAPDIHSRYVKTHGPITTIAKAPKTPGMPKPFDVSDIKPWSE